MSKEIPFVKSVMKLMPTAEEIEEFCQENDYTDAQRDAIFDAALNLFLESVKKKLKEPA